MREDNLIMYFIWMIFGFVLMAIGIGLFIIGLAFASGLKPDMF